MTFASSKVNAKQTRPNAFGSITAKKDDKNPIESIFCHERL